MFNLANEALWETLMLDQQTKTQLQQKFQTIKPQLQQQFSGLTEQDLQSGQSDPDQLVQKISQKTGQPSTQIEQQLKTLVQSA
ncbi:MAG: hypothetical protein H0X16_09125 [Chloroflexi bacterium]|nr:hypothetical protein [Chloroflexota bacterium]HEV8054020.1 hypothetical protein [Candidatus Limnocylindrales bacterium]